MAFVRNNIRYRSAASKALEGYYNSKAFILNQLVTSDNGFGEEAKEILLLLFNRHADWLFHTESLLLDKAEVSEDDIQAMQAELSRVTNLVKETLQENADVFTEEYIEHWLFIHQQKFEVLIKMLEDVQGMTQIIAFPYVTECLIEYLNSTLFELYELDCLLGSEVVRNKLSTNDSHPYTMVLHIDDISLQYSSERDVSAEVERIEYYEKKVLDRRSKIHVKVRDYVVRSEGSKPRSQIIEELRSFIESRSWLEDLEVVNPNSDRQN